MEGCCSNPGEKTVRPSIKAITENTDLSKSRRPSDLERK